MKNLVTLSLFGALLLAVAGISADDNILLPTDGVVEANTRPWECCDKIEQSPLRSLPPRYRCNDVVKHCAATCAECDELPRSFPGHRRFVCRDWFIGFNPGPKCTGKKQHCDESSEEVVAAPATEEKERPWACCDTTVCTRSWPPTCNCADTVAECGGACVQCKPVASEPGRFQCLDRYHGFPGPKCH